MKKGLKRTRKTLKRVTLGGGEESFNASVTKDLRGLVVHEVPSRVVTTLTSSETIYFHANVSAYYQPCSIVTTNMRETAGLQNDVVGPILCVIPNWAPEKFDVIRFEKVHVSTPFIALGGKPHFSLVDVDTEELWEKVSLNQPITLHPNLCDPIDHGDWRNGPKCTLGSGFKFNGMLTTMPNGGSGLETIKTVRERVEGLLVLLTLLNGGNRVSADKVEVDICGEKYPVEILFPTRTFDVLEFGMDHYFRNRLLCVGGLRSIGMEGLERWMDWHSRFRNKAILDRWLFSRDRLNSISVLEGIGRGLLRDDGYRGDIYFERAVRNVIDTFGLEDSVSNDHVKALNDINNKLIKHIGDLSEEDDSKYRRDSGPLMVLTSFLVGYALLRWALGELPTAWDDSWRQEIEDTSKKLTALLI